MKNPSLDCENSVNDFACSKGFNRNGCNRGYTFIEVCIVIAIIGSILCGNKIQ
jgi:prepilin-type N-terminal cleavage/methylation domain-containing protein